MLLVLQILLGLIAAILLLLAGRWLMTPDSIMKQYDIQSTSATGKNYLRGDIGGILLTGAIMLSLFLYQGSAQWLYPGVILLGAVVLGRTISLFVDGNSKKGVQAIVVELIIIGLMFGIDYLS